MASIVAQTANSTPPPDAKALQDRCSFYIFHIRCRDLLRRSQLCLNRRNVRVGMFLDEFLHGLPDLRHDIPAHLAARQP